MSHMDLGLLEMRDFARLWRKILAENRNYWAEVVAQREDARRLRAVAGIPLEDLERYARFYWAAQDVDCNVYGGSEL